MKEKLVSFKVAKLAKEKGFKDVIGVWRGKHYYNYKGELDGDSIEEIKHRKDKPNKFISIAAPTQSLLAKWLREKYDIDINIKRSLSYYKSYYYSIIDNNNFDDDNEDLIQVCIINRSYETAFEDALITALKLI